MSSFIFVVILAVWAVYLVQHWVRRRDHLATARSVDRFSESMRVLERRRALPRPDLVEHAPPTTSVLLRPARPEVVVKRGASASPAAPKAVPAAKSAVPAATKTVPAVATAVGPTSTHRHAQQHAQVRAAGLLLGSVVMITLVVLTLTQVLHWAWSFVGLALLAGTVAAIRWSVARDRTVRRAPVRSRSAQSPTGDAPVRAAADLTASEGAQRSPLAAQARAAVGVSSRPARRSVDIDRRPAPVLYDIDSDPAELSATGAEPTELTGVEAPATQAPVAHDVADVAPAAEVAPEELPSGAWSPVPVPPPTYTLKARAHRGNVAPTGSAQLPMDGTEMALDEEFEDLPSVDRVG